MQFSVLLATRDRPALFAEALASVLSQGCEDREIIVVDDGSDPAHRNAYEQVLAPVRLRLGARLQVHHLLRRPHGHGQSYALNVAASHARGAYLAILDDDDSWTDDDHLSRCARSIDADTDLYMAHQAAFRAGRPADEQLWLGGLREGLRGHAADAQGTWTVSLPTLLAASGFCHLNCLIVRRGLWDAVGGMDEAIRWECDRDLFLRLIDAASGRMLFNPAIVSRHNVPDPTKSANMTTALGQVAKLIQQLRVVDKAALFARHEEVRATGRRHRNWTLQKLAAELSQAGDPAGAAHYGLAAGLTALSPGSTARLSLGLVGSLLGRRRQRAR